MLTGLQIQINALNAIIPDSFIFVLDSTDRSFIYKSKECGVAVNEIHSLDRNIGIEDLFINSEYYNSDNESYAYMIRKVSSHTFLGFFASKEKFSDARIRDAKDCFLEVTNV